jgi:hypothetical protein
MASIAILALVLALAACGSSGSALSSTVSTARHKPGVTLECVGRPCGSNSSKNTWHGIYYVRKTNLPPNTEVVIRVTYPDHEPYPFGMYSHPGELYGLQGNIESTDRHGLLPKFKWAALNPGGLVDPPGVYHLTFRFKKAGHKVMQVKIPMELKKLP